MFTPKEIEVISLAAEKLFKDLEQRVMLDIVRRLKNNDNEIIRSADWQINRLYELGKGKEEIKKEIQRALKLSNEEVDKIYNEVIKSGYARQEDVYNEIGKDFIPYEDNAELQQLVSAMSAQTKDEFKNITGSLGFAVRNPDGSLSYQPIAEYYQNTLDKGMMDIASGMFDYNTVLKRTVKEMTNSGLRFIDYASGWHNRVDVASRRAIMTGFNQVIAQVNESNAEKLGTEYFETSYHIGARPTHQIWQGRVYKKSELETICGLGTVTGLCGANCYHSYHPFIPGIDKRIYTDEELNKMMAEENTPKEYGDKKYTTYEALQRQRRLETKMRAQRQEIKLLKEGNADELDIISARARYRATSAEYARFSEEMNLPQQRERVMVDGLGDIGKGKYKLPVENLKLDDIIELKDNTIRDVIKIGKLNTTVAMGKQGKHIIGHNNYIDGRSYLTIPTDEIQSLVDKFKGTGYLLRDNSGKWKKQEVVFTNSVIGVDIDNVTGNKYETQGFKIHYSNKGVHIVPKRG